MRRRARRRPRRGRRWAVPARGPGWVGRSLTFAFVLLFLPGKARPMARRGTSGGARRRAIGWAGAVSGAGADLPPPKEPPDFERPQGADHRSARRGRVCRGSSGGGWGGEGSAGGANGGSRVSHLRKKHDLTGFSLSLRAGRVARPQTNLPDAKPPRPARVAKHRAPEQLRRPRECARRSSARYSGGRRPELLPRLHEHLSRWILDQQIRHKKADPHY